MNFFIGSFAYNYLAGFKIGIGIHFVPAWQLKLNLSLSSFQFIINEETVGINLLALVLVYIIESLKENVRT